MSKGSLLGTVLALLLAAPLAGQVVDGVLFEDRDDDGVRDPGEPLLEGLTVRLLGNDGATVDRSDSSGADGSFRFDALADGCYLLAVEPGDPDLRVGGTRMDCDGPAAEPHPVGTRRWSVLPGLQAEARADDLTHYALGDSIAEPLSACTFLGQDTDYLAHVQERLRCVAPSTTTVKDSYNFAIAGSTTEDLLRPSYNGNTVREAIAAGPDLVTISIGGNDFLALDDGFGNLNDACAALAMAETRKNLQEILSSLTTELPGADVEINTVYDNFGYDCPGSSTQGHNRWVPIANHLLRELAWGQVRRATVAEIWPDYAHASADGVSCCGFGSQICTIPGDYIHPNESGARIHEAKLWESLGGIDVGPAAGGFPGDPVAATSHTVEIPYLRRVDTRYPTLTRDETDAGVLDAAEALAIDGSPARVPPYGGSFHVEGFDAEPRGITIVRAVVGVRYRTSGTYLDDLYWFEASFDPAFPDPGDRLSTWDTVLPIVGGSEGDFVRWQGGSCNRPATGAGMVLVVPAPAAWREVTAPLTRNVLFDDPPSGDHEFPPVAFADLATLSVRLRSRTVGGPDAFLVEWDGAWVDLYGYSAPAPDLDGVTKEAWDSMGTPVSQAVADDVLTYRIVVPNDGDAPALEVTVYDQLPVCLEVVGGPRVDGVPGGGVDGFRFMTVPLGDIPAGERRVVEVDVRVNASCEGRSLDNQAFVISTSPEIDPAGVRSDDPATPDPDDPTIVSVLAGPAGVLTAFGIAGLTDPTPGDPNDCTAPRMEAGTHDCLDCIEQAPGTLWRVPGGSASGGDGPGVRFYEVAWRGCPAEPGATERLCLGADGTGDLLLGITGLTGPCLP